MADLSDLKVKVTFDIEPTPTSQTLLRRLIQEEIQAVLHLSVSSEALQESVRRIAREEIEAFKKEQNEATRARFGPSERKR